MKKTNKLIQWFKAFGWGWKAPFNYISAIFHPIKFFKCLKYPFIKTRNRWTGKFMGYTFTEDEQIPRGWYKAFGKDLLNDIKKAGKESRKRIGKHLSWKKMITWEQIKEKFGTLRLYASATDEIMLVLDKYEIMSRFYCINCGKKAKYVTHGWIEYYCEDCFEDVCKEWDKEKNDYILPKPHILKQLKNKCALHYPEDLPSWTTMSTREEFKTKSEFDSKYKQEKKNVKSYGSFTDNAARRYWFIEYKKPVEIKIDLEAKYGINFKELTE